MGAVDLVVQVEAPASVASGLQRIGRAGHQVGAREPRRRSSPSTAATCSSAPSSVERMQAGAIEALRYPRNPLDVLAQQIVAMVAMDDWTVDELERWCAARRRSPSCRAPRSTACSTCSPAATRRDSFAELRPRITWDRVDARLTPRPSAQRLAVTSGGTIPDRGLYGVFLAGERQTRVGELDEEMVYESRAGEVFLLGASSWRIEDITHDRVLVSPAPGQPGKMPFWRGDAPGRPVELGARDRRASCASCGELGDDGARRRLRDGGLDERAADNLLRYLAEQREATGALPDDRTIVVERFRDESATGASASTPFFGARVHAPWAPRDRGAAAPAARHRRAGDVHRRRHRRARARRATTRRRPTPCSSTPRRSRSWSTAEVGDSALFASRFRECAARALLLPRRRPGAAHAALAAAPARAALLQVAGGIPSFPIVLETYRECLQDVFDLPALAELLRDVRSARSASSRSRPSCRRRSPARCCSATSAPSCTRATRRWPSAARRRWRSTAPCSPS